jgi:hypothetical protein
VLRSARETPVAADADGPATRRSYRLPPALASLALLASCAP